MRVFIEQIVARIAASFLVFLPCTAIAQEINMSGFDEQQFISELNEALKGSGAVVSEFTHIGPKPFSDLIDQKMSWEGNDAELLIDVPEYGVGIVDESGEILKVFGPSAPISYDADGKITAIAGTMLRSGQAYEILGANQYAQVVTEAGYEAGLDGGVRRAIDTIRGATRYIAESLCGSDGRPSEITLNLNAEFKLVFAASTGTSVKWVMEETCSNY